MRLAIRFGTCSWNYSSWVGLVYSEPQRRAAAYLSERFGRFLERIEPMLPRLDAIMLEFEYLNRDKMPSLDAFLATLDAFLAAAGEPARRLPLAIETRNKNYLTAAYFSFLRDRRLMPVFSEKIYMPHVYDVYQQYKDAVKTDVVIRLLGGDRTDIEKKTHEQWNTIVEPKPDKKAIVTMARDITHRGHMVTINVNNHYEGSAPLTIEAMRSMLHVT